MSAIPGFQYTCGKKSFCSALRTLCSRGCGGSTNLDVWFSDFQPQALTLNIYNAIWRLLSIIVEGMGSLAWDVGIIVERVQFLTLNLGFIEWACSFVK